MIGGNQRAALTALQSARSIVARLDGARHPEENAADLVEVWSAVQTALRSLLGGSALAGQPLIRELRQRELLSLEQAHSVLEFLAVRDRVQSPTYQPSASDLDVAREAFGSLEQWLSTDHEGSAGAAAGASAAVAAAGATYSPLPPPEDPRRAGRGPGLAILLVLLALLAVAGGYVWYASRAAGPDIAEGVQAYMSGRREQARGIFERAARANPRAASPHIYLGRIAREEGDLATAGNELRTAVQLEPGNATAHREMGAFFLARGQQFVRGRRPDLAQPDFDAARRSYLRAIAVNPADRTAQGFLGCALIRLGRTDEGTRWLARAGPGGWSGCAATTGGAVPPS